MGQINGANNNIVQIISNQGQMDVSESSQLEKGASSPSSSSSKIQENGKATNVGTKTTSPTADQPVARATEDYKRIIRELRVAGQGLRSETAQPGLLRKPAWFEEDLFENAKSVYGRHFMGVNFAHLSGLLLLVRVNSIYRTLSATGKSDSVAKLFKRYYQTVVHVKRWYEGDIFEEESEAHRSLLIVRGMHNKVSAGLNDNNDQCSNQKAQAAEANAANIGASSNLMLEQEDEQAEDGVEMRSRRRWRRQDEARVHISEYDIMITQFAFLGFIVTRPKYVGLIDDFSEHDLKSMLHFWRVIGHYLGASDEFNLCSRDFHQVVGLCEAIMELEFKQSILDNPVSSAPGIMGVNIVRSIKFIPMLTIYGITKYLYELIGIDTGEFEERATRYSRLSYTLIRLVMSRLLAYRPFRWFNNGLTRLSLFLVGKMEATFSNHLDAKYGQELKL